jgi:hypothetical protein
MIVKRRRRFPFTPHTTPRLDVLFRRFFFGAIVSIVIVLRMESMAGRNDRPDPKKPLLEKGFPSVEVPIADRLSRRIERADRLNLV